MSKIEWLVLALVVAIVGALVWGAAESTRERMAMAPILQEADRDEGRRAYRAGVPANANPYIGSRYHTGDARRWLDGYIEAKTAAEANRAD